MRIVSISENLKIEKRIAITPEIAKKYIALGLEVALSENYAVHLGIRDNEYTKIGAVLSKDEKEIINSADVIVQLTLPSDEISLSLKKDQILIGILNIKFLNIEKKFYTKKSNNIFFVFIIGMAFGFGWTPCIGPILGSILALASTEETIYLSLIHI